MPSTLHSSLVLSGGSCLLIVDTLSGLEHMKADQFCWWYIFLSCSVTWFHSSCSVMSLPWTMMSSMEMVITYRHCRHCSLNQFLWKIWGAVIPNGRCLKQYCPSDLMNVDNLWVSLSSKLCQNPEAASTVEKTVEPLSCVVISSYIGRINCSLFTAL